MPSEAHEERVLILRALAHLIGCIESIGNSFPDGSRPDVLAIRRVHRTIFIGEAKASEGPGDRAAVARLRHYMLWARSSCHTTSGVFAVCAPDTGGEWLRSLTDLARECSLAYAEPSYSKLGERVVVAAIRWERDPVPSSLLRLGHARRTRQLPHLGYLSRQTARPWASPFTWSE